MPAPRPKPQKAAIPGARPGQTGASIGGFTQPPAFSFDPAIEAQRRAAQRGLQDIIRANKIAGKRSHQDLHTALTDVATKSARGQTDIGTSLTRGNQRLANQQADTATHAGRTQADLSTRLSDIGRSFGQLASRQFQSANAAGVGEGGTLAAAAAARAGNQRLAEAPVHTAQTRTGEDLATSLARIGTARAQLGVDSNSQLARLAQDVARSQQLARQDFKRQRQDRRIKGQQARREAAISNTDLVAQEIYQAQSNHPGAVAKYAHLKRGGKK